jgi:hypothetical protein
VLAEDVLTFRDVQQIRGLHADRDVHYHVLVAADVKANLLASLVDHLSLGELREALDVALGRQPTPEKAHHTAEGQLSANIAAFADVRASVDGAVVTEDPLPALRTAVTEQRATEVIVVTLPRAVEDTFHTDWASRAREALRVPVLHLYTGTNLLG